MMLAAMAPDAARVGTVQTRLVKILERPAGQQFAPFQEPLESATRLGSTSSTMTTRGIIKTRRICCCSQPATSYLSPSARCAPVNGLAGCYVSTSGKPHEYFDLTGGLTPGKLRGAKTISDSRMLPGMTLRDWFAGQALIALVCRFDDPVLSSGQNIRTPIGSAVCTFPTGSRMSIMTSRICSALCLLLFNLPFTTQSMRLHLWA